jgi:hypothetical protein
LFEAIFLRICYFFVLLVGSPVEIGQNVTARILDIVKSDGIVDLSLRPDLVKSETVAKSSVNKMARKVPKLFLIVYFCVLAWLALPELIVEPVIGIYIL